MSSRGRKRVAAAGSTDSPAPDRERGGGGGAELRRAAHQQRRHPTKPGHRHRRERRRRRSPDPWRRRLGEQHRSVTTVVRPLIDQRLGCPLPERHAGRLRYPVGNSRQRCGQSRVQRGLRVWRVGLENLVARRRCRRGSGRAPWSAAFEPIRLVTALDADHGVVDSACTNPKYTATPAEPSSCHRRV
jgi:hypothetical protein